MPKTDRNPVTERTRVKRMPDRASYNLRVIEQVLDEALVCHVGFEYEGSPCVIPMAYARVDDAILLHGSRKSRLVRHLARGCPVSIAVTLLDGIVLARSHFHHSLNYRSVVIFGEARALRGVEEKRAALWRLVEHIVPGRAPDARAPDESEIAATEVLSVPLAEASAKIRRGPPQDPEADLRLDVWAGEIPLERVFGKPLAAPELAAGHPIPVYASNYRRPTATGRPSSPDRNS